MARRSYKKIYYRRKGRWSANIRSITANNISFSPGSDYTTLDLCTNPAQTDVTVSQQYTVKNFEINFELSSNDATNLESLAGYIMYVPQGMIVTETYPNLHPEYIMNYKFYGSAVMENNNNRGPLRMKTRLSRRLQTGDKIIFLITGYNDHSTADINLEINGLVRWYTKAN